VEVAKLPGELLQVLLGRGPRVVVIFLNMALTPPGSMFRTTLGASAPSAFATRHTPPLRPWGESYGPQGALSHTGLLVLVLQPMKAVVHCFTFNHRLPSIVFRLGPHQVYAESETSNVSDVSLSGKGTTAQEGYYGGGGGAAVSLLPFSSSWAFSVAVGRSLCHLSPRLLCAFPPISSRIRRSGRCSAGPRGYPRWRCSGRSF